MVKIMPSDLRTSRSTHYQICIWCGSIGVMARGPPLNNLTENIYRRYAITPYSPKVVDVVLYAPQIPVTQPLPYLPWLDNFHCIGSTTILPTPSCHGSGDSSKELAYSTHSRSKRENPDSSFVLILIGVIVGDILGESCPGWESARERATCVSHL